MDAKEIKTATIVGHSMGSFVAQQVAVSAPGRVERLVLVGSATTVRNNVVKDLESEVGKLGDPIPETFVRDFQTSTAFKSLPPEFMNTVVRESLKPSAHVWREVMAGMLKSDTETGLATIKAPTLILWGDKETIFARSEQDLLVRSFPTRC